jgi:very-long-chain (3R)-3-hydroxyacyl-CoA dehydratase
MADVAKPPRPGKQQSAAKTAYLILYNSASAIAWLTVLGRLLLLYTLRGPFFVSLGVGEWLKWTQTAAGMEILHAALGTVPSSSPMADNVSSSILLNN